MLSFSFLTCFYPPSFYAGFFTVLADHHYDDSYLEGNIADLYLVILHSLCFFYKKIPGFKTQDFLRRVKSLNNLFFVILFVIIKEAYENFHVFLVTIDII